MVVSTVGVKMAVPSKYIQAVMKAKGRPKSTDWFREKIREFGTPKTLDLIRDGKRSTTPHFGRLNMFVYAPRDAKEITLLRYIPFGVTSGKIQRWISRYQLSLFTYTTKNEIT